MIIPVSRIGFGTGDYFWNSRMSDADKIKLIRIAIDHDITLIDTAAEYGHGISEELVGKAIKGIRECITVATKFSPRNHGYHQVIKSADDSLKRLGTDYIDLFQIHWPNPSVPIAETMQAMVHLVDSGKVKSLGFCNFNYREVEEVFRLQGKEYISSMQNEYNLFERSAEYTGLLDYCIEQSLSFLAYSPLDQGRTAAMSEEQSTVLIDIAENYNMTVPQVIINWITSRSSLTPLISSTKKEHIIENALSIKSKISNGDIGRISSAFLENIHSIPIDEIRVSLSGEYGHDVYQTLEEALGNRFDFSPSPLELSKSMVTKRLLKPVRLVRSTDSKYKYDLIGGRIRFWAWVIAHDGKEPIPSFVRDNI